MNRRAYLLLVGAAVVAGVAAVAVSLSLGERLPDPDGSLGPSWVRLPVMVLGAFVVDVVPRSSYRKLKNFLPQVPHSPYDTQLHDIDRALLLGHEPAIVLHRLVPGADPQLTLRHAWVHRVMWVYLWATGRHAARRRGSPPCGADTPRVPADASPVGPRHPTPLATVTGPFGGVRSEMEQGSRGGPRPLDRERSWGIGGSNRPPATPRRPSLRVRSCPTSQGDTLAGPAPPSQGGGASSTFAPISPSTAAKACARRGPRRILDRTASPDS